MACGSLPMHRPRRDDRGASEVTCLRSEWDAVAACHSTETTYRLLRDGDGEADGDGDGDREEHIRRQTNK